MAIADQVLVGSYDYRLVALSVVIAIVAAYASEHRSVGSYEGEQGCPFD